MVWVDPKNRSKINGFIGGLTLPSVVPFRYRGDAPSVIKTEAIMALDKQLVLSQNTKQAAPKDAVTARRNRLINRIHNQLEYLQREKEGQLPQRAYRRLARWWWQEGNPTKNVVPFIRENWL